MWNDQVALISHCSLATPKLEKHQCDGVTRSWVDPITPCVSPQTGPSREDFLERTGISGSPHPIGGPSIHGERKTPELYLQILIEDHA